MSAKNATRTSSSSTELILVGDWSSWGWERSCSSGRLWSLRL